MNPSVEVVWMRRARQRWESHARCAPRNGRGGLSNDLDWNARRRSRAEFCGRQWGLQAAAAELAWKRATGPRWHGRSCLAAGVALTDEILVGVMHRVPLTVAKMQPRTQRSAKLDRFSLSFLIKGDQSAQKATERGQRLWAWTWLMRPEQGGGRICSGCVKEKGTLQLGAICGGDLRQPSNL